MSRTLRHRLARRLAARQELLDADVARGRGAQPELVGQHLQPHQAPHPRHQLQVVDRLGQEIVGAGFKPADAVRHVIERGNHHDRDMRGRRIALQPPADLETVHVGHHHVEQHDVDLAVLAGLQRVGAVAGGQHLEIFGEQPDLEQLHIGRNVVDDEDACGHQASPR